MSHTILIIDDDESILAIYSDMLRRRGFHVLTSAGAEAGLAMLIDSDNHIDLVVLDIMMAKMDGWQFLDYLRKDLGLGELEMPVIVMSAVEGIDLDMEFMRHRANDWVTKPVQPMSKLVHKIRALLGITDAISSEGADATRNR